MKSVILCKTEHGRLLQHKDQQASSSNDSCMALFSSDKLSHNKATIFAKSVMAPCNSRITFKVTNKAAPLCTNAFAFQRGCISSSSRTYLPDAFCSEISCLSALKHNELYRQPSFSPKRFDTQINVGGKPWLAAKTML